MFSRLNICEYLWKILNFPVYYKCCCTCSVHVEIGKSNAVSLWYPWKQLFWYHLTIKGVSNISFAHFKDRHLLLKVDSQPKQIIKYICIKWLVLLELSESIFKLDLKTLKNDLTYGEYVKGPAFVFWTVKTYFSPSFWYNFVFCPSSSFLGILVGAYIISLDLATKWSINLIHFAV